MKLYNVVASHRVPSIRSRKSKDVSLRSKMTVRVMFKNMLIISVKVKNSHVKPVANWQILTAGDVQAEVAGH